MLHLKDLDCTEIVQFGGIFESGIGIFESGIGAAEDRGSGHICTWKIVYQTSIDLARGICEPSGGHLGAWDGTDGLG